VRHLTADEARLAALWAQGFLDPIAGVSAATAQRAGAQRQQDLVHIMLRHLGAVQLDTISVLARSHELVAYARFGAIGRDRVESAYWSGDRSFEYWSHAACVLPMESWPLFAFRRRFYSRRGIRWHDVSTSSVNDVLARLRAEGPLTTAHIGGAKRGGEWWDWSEAKVAIEWLLDIGTVVVSRRTGWRREYDLAERVVAEELRPRAGWVDTDGVVGPDDESCVRALVQAGADAMGVGTADDVADVHRLKVADVVRHADELGLVPVRVDGWGKPAWATAAALAWLDDRPRARHRTTLLSPFDSLVWHRPRTERIFGLQHRLEAYTPAHKRVHGYFAMPVLHQGRLVARVDPKRENETLRARRVTLESESRAAVDGIARALHEAAAWAGAKRVVVDEVVPVSARAALERAVSGTSPG
jgi:uncharacterized protein YcaQ